MQLIVTCAGCGAKYRGESGPKKFRCAACSNLFTFPDQPKTASTGTILCSNCWTETVPTEKLKTCGFCSQRVSPRYGGLAAEDKQVKVKQPSVRNDPNLVKAVTRPNPSGAEIPAGGGTPPNESNQTQFVSSEWKEIGGELKPDIPDPKKTQAFELMAELKKELEPEMQGVVESILKSQQVSLKAQQQHEAALLAETRGEQPETMKPTELQPAVTGNEFPGHHENPAAHDAPHPSERPASTTAERHAPQNNSADPDGRHAQDHAPRESAANDDAVRELQAKVAELTAMVAADKRAKEQLLHDRVQLEEMWRERDAKVGELTARLNSDSTTRTSLVGERDQLRELKRDHEASRAELESRLHSEQLANQGLQRERDQLAESVRNLEGQVAQISTRMASDRDVRDHASRSRDELAETHQEMQARVADLEARLNNERKSKEALIHERDVLSDRHRELQARIADLESRLGSEREAKQAITLKHDEHLEAKNELDAKAADLEMRLNLEREAKEAASTERAKLHEVRQELEAKAADLTRRHANEREARERVLKEHNDLLNEHRELIAKVADFKARIKAEQDIKDSVRKERDEALARADSAEARVEKSEAEAGRVRKNIHAQLEKFSAEHNGTLAKLAEKTSDLMAHAALTRKRLEEATHHHGEKIETAAADLKSKLEQEHAEVSAKLKKLLQDHEARDSARLAVQSGPMHTPLPPAAASRGSSIQPSSDSGRFPTGPQKPVFVPNEGSGAFKSVPPPSELAPAATSNSSSSTRHPVVVENTEPVDPALDKSSGTFWAKVFKRPATKT